MKIVLLTGNCLCHNPRVVKEATTLRQAGYEVEVLGAWADATLKARDLELLRTVSFRFTPVVDLTAIGPAPRLRASVNALRKVAGRLAHRFGNVANRWQLGDAVTALELTARQRNAELFIAHSEAGLVVARDLLRSGRCVGVDMEDWFSNDLLPEARRNRPVQLLEELERSLLNRGIYATCPSNAMSLELARQYQCAQPVVIYNAFPWADRLSIDRMRKDRPETRRFSIHWYSQTIGPGRGLEDLFAALPHLAHDAEIHLRGQPVAGFAAWLAARVPHAWRERVFVHGLVPNEQLLSRIAEHDIGFAGEMTYCKSRGLTITNKILHYLLGGLAVVASDTAGQREVAALAPEAVALYGAGDAVALAAQLNVLLASAAQLTHAKAAALRAAEKVFCWERQEKFLLDAVSRALETRTACSGGP